jgi:hypothetical protein
MGALCSGWIAAAGTREPAAIWLETWMADPVRHGNDDQVSWEVLYVKR